MADEPGKRHDVRIAGYSIKFGFKSVKFEMVQFDQLQLVCIAGGFLNFSFKNVAWENN